MCRVWTKLNEKAGQDANEALLAMERRLLHAHLYETRSVGAGIGASNRVSLESGAFQEERQDGATPEDTDPEVTRCAATLKNGERCKREGKSIFDGRSGLSLYYCYVHRKLLREIGRLPEVAGAGSR
jgi:hypothetical protein